MANNSKHIYNTIKPLIITDINAQINLNSPSGTVRSITVGNGLSANPATITTTGTIELTAGVSQLIDTNITNPVTNHILSWNGTSWINQAISLVAGSSISFFDLLNNDVTSAVSNANKLVTLNSTGTCIIATTNDYKNIISGNNGVKVTSATNSSVIELDPPTLPIHTVDVVSDDYLLYYDVSESIPKRKTFGTIGLCAFNNTVSKFFSRDDLKTGTAIEITDTGTSIIIGVCTTQVPLDFSSGVTGILTIANGGTSSGTSLGARSELGLAYNQDILIMDGPSYRNNMFGNNLVLLSAGFGLSLSKSGTCYTSGEDIILVNPNDGSLINMGISLQIDDEGIITGPLNTGVCITNINLLDSLDTYVVQSSAGSGASYQVTPDASYLLFGASTEGGAIGIRDYLGNLEVKSTHSGLGSTWQQIFPLSLDGVCDVVITSPVLDNFLIYDSSNTFVNTALTGDNNFSLTLAQAGTSTVIGISPLSQTIPPSVIISTPNNITSTEFGYLTGLVDNVQDQLDLKAGPSPNGQAAADGDLLAWRTGTCWNVLRASDSGTGYLLGMSTSYNPQWQYLYNLINDSGGISTAGDWKNSYFVNVESGSCPGALITLPNFLQNNLCALTGGLNIETVNQKLEIDSSNLYAGSTFGDSAVDHIVYYDSTSSFNKKMIIDDLAKELAGTNLTGENGQISWEGTSPVILPLYNDGSSLLAQASVTTYKNSLAGVSNSTLANGSSLVYCNGVSWYYINLGDYVT